MRTLALVLALGACSQAPDDTVPLPGEGWESIGVPSGVGGGVHRLEVPGGWIVTRKYGESVALAFVPDPDKAWKF